MSLGGKRGNGDAVTAANVSTDLQEQRHRRPYS